MKLKKLDFNEERYAKPWHQLPEDQHRIKKIIEIVGQNKRVLDVGCYDGSISKLLLPNKNEVYGVDISEKAVELAKLNGIQAFTCDIEDKLPFLDNFFDVVVAGEIIEHIFDVDNFLNEINRILKIGGYLVLTTPNLACFNSRWRLLLGKNPYNIETSLGSNSAGHIRYFVKNSLSELLKAHGLTIDVFASDIVQYGANRYSVILARLFPTFGMTLIVKAIKNVEEAKGAIQ